MRDAGARLVGERVDGRGSVEHPVDGTFDDVVRVWSRLRELLYDADWWWTIDA